MTSGLHHITLITRKVQANIDFYLGFLGLRLVKRTAGFEDATQLHLFYGDRAATPGSIVTFLVWEDGSPGRVGQGAPSEIAFAIRPGAIGFWLTRALQFAVPARGPSIEFGEHVLRLTDPDGVIVKLVGTVDLGGGSPWDFAGIAQENAIIRLRGATMLSERPTETIAFLTHYMGFTEQGREGAVTRLISDLKDSLDVRDASGFWTAAPGTGTIDHIAVRARDRRSVETASSLLADGAHGNTAVHDRKYFYSLYVREPGGSLIEFATDGPGFTIDESLEQLGGTLFIPPHSTTEDADIRPMLPQFGLPGERRIVYRDLPFVHRIHEADAPDGSTLVLLHGTGGNEASLLPFGRRLAPHSTLIGLRGRSTEEGSARFFRRFSETTFDQKDIVAEAEAFTSFVDDAGIAYGIAPPTLTFVGYSNGANMLAAVMLLHPAIVRRAILMRPMSVLEKTDSADLDGCAVLLISGRLDHSSAPVDELERQFQLAGANVTHTVIPAGHELTDFDLAVANEWLRHQYG